MRAQRQQLSNARSLQFSRQAFYPLLLLFCAKVLTFSSVSVVELVNALQRKRISLLEDVFCCR